MITSKKTITAKIGRHLFGISVVPTEKNKLHLYFDWKPYAEWQTLKEEIKSMEGARFQRNDETGHAYWEVLNSPRNTWVLDYLDSRTPNPYLRYDKIHPNIQPNRSTLYKHQIDMLTHAFHTKQCIIAAEMGTGKTLVFIELLEKVKPKTPWYIAPRFALTQLKLLFKDWEAQVWPQFLSYEEMRSMVTKWPDGRLAPDFIIFDESAYIKNPPSQRSQCAKYLADGMRKDHPDPYIVLASGAPAPKSPKDWWMQCEIACPGFLKEGKVITFENRLALIRKETSFAGGSYPKLVTWWDDEKKCRLCGEYKEHPNHGIKKQNISEVMTSVEKGLAGLVPTTNQIVSLTDEVHTFESSVNEVARLNKRLKGLVFIAFKKDCLDLPDKIYRIVKCDPSATTKRAANLITRTATTTIEGLTRLRELSDGFQYKIENSDEETQCPICGGTGQMNEYEEGTGTPSKITCTKCEGKGSIFKEIRIARRVSCPKDDALKELLDENEEIGRIVIFAAFNASIDRIVEVCKAKNWETIRADGSTRTEPYGMLCSTPLKEHPLSIFQDKNLRIPRIAFVANPKTAKTSLTLTAASMIVYYSNSFDGDDRIQSEDRIHRIGMDNNRGAIIVDLIHLEADNYVRENLIRKRQLQSITLGEFQKAIQETI